MSKERKRFHYKKGDEIDIATEEKRLAAAKQRKLAEMKNNRKQKQI